MRGQTYGSPSSLRRHIHAELRVMAVRPETAVTEHGAWVLGVAKRHGWFPRLAAQVAAAANKIAGDVR